MEALVSREQRESVSNFYEFIEKVATIRTKTKTTYKDAVEQYMDLAVLHNFLPEIRLDKKSAVDFLTAERPDLPKCPQPDPLIIDWIPPGWQDVRREEIKPYPEKVFAVSSDDGEDKSKEQFRDHPTRNDLFSSWVGKRSDWILKYKETKKKLEIYEKLDHYKSILDRESNRVGCFVANGFIRSKDGAFDYPILMQRAYIVQDVNGIKPIIRISLCDELIDVQEVVLRQLGADFKVNYDAVTVLRSDLEEKLPNILDTDDIRPILSKFIAILSTKSLWREELSSDAFDEETKLICYPHPMIFIAPLPSGLKDAVSKIRNLIDEGDEIPSPIRHLLCGYKDGEQILDDEADIQPTISERLAMIGGESEEILLSLPANKEQLEIAKRIRKCDAVLVQGPPGTGKTHTIANLLGDLLASGKRVLVTSTKDKALNVLRDKLPDEVRPLCVTLLEQSGSSTEMVKSSVDGICSKIASPDYSIPVLVNKSKRLRSERNELMKQLAENRKYLYEIRNQESAKVVFNGRDQTLSKWAEELQKHEEDIAYLPDSNLRASTFNVPMDAIGALIRTNVDLTPQEDKALSQWLPLPDEVPTPEEIQLYLDEVHDDKERQDVSGVVRTVNRRHVTFTVGKVSVTIEKSKEGDLKIKDELAKREILPWMHSVMLAGMGSQNIENTPWGRLLSNITTFVAHCNERNSSAVVSGRKFEFKDTLSPEVIKETACWYIKNFPNGKIDLFTKLLGLKNCSLYEDNLSGIRVNGQRPSNLEMFNEVVKEAEFLKAKADLTKSWDGLIAAEGGQSFSDFGSHPEREVIKFVASIEMCFNWWNTTGAHTYALCEELEISKELFPDLNEFSSNELLLSTVWEVCRKILIPISRFIEGASKTIELEEKKAEITRIYTAPSNMEVAEIVEHLREAALSDASVYAEQYNELCRIQSLRPIWKKRHQLLEQIRNSGGVLWANKISNREEGWTDEQIVHQAEKCLYWREIAYMLGEYYGKDYSKLQRETVEIACKFRKKTAELAAVLSWLHLKIRLRENPNLEQDLKGWVGTVSKIGKGTGKHAKRLMMEAKNKAKECQKAIPIWIMTIQRALLTLDPREKFDVIIVDEASQSDVTGLAVLYMGKRIIVVGDDQQVSPMGVGVGGDDINSIRRMYLENQGIKNDNLYDETTSIYDIVKTISSPVMLKEHFRCVPQIIEFSNKLSYDNNIEPLRDESKVNIRPFLVSHRVSNGRCGSNNENIEEAYEIATLIRSCMDQPEYKGKTYGVISMLSGSGRQVVEIEKALCKVLTPKQRSDGRISVGLPADFQGDERDVIFLSMVHSQNKEPGKPMSIIGFGTNDSTRKRYNVAVSRAKDQLWVVHSFDPDTELKPDDIRKRLILHVRNPHAKEAEINVVAQQVESPFEESVARDLIERGYKLIPQYPVGGYRLDFVVKGEKNTALECDGERYHSSVEAIEADMERQAVLERCGWSFVRIRGGEYYRNPKAAIDCVCQALDKLGIKPNTEMSEEQPEESDLLNRVRMGARAIREQLKLEPMLSEETVYEAVADLEKSSSVASQEVNREADETEDIEKGTVAGVQELDENTSKQLSDEPAGGSVITHANDDIDQQKGDQNIAEINNTLNINSVENVSERAGFTTEKKVSAVEDSQGKLFDFIESSLYKEKKMIGVRWTNKGKDLGLKDLSVNVKKRILQEDTELVSIFEEHGWTVFDNRDSDGGCLWVIAEEQDFIETQKMIKSKFNLEFKYSSKKSKKRGNKAGWWLVNKTTDRAKE